jgi:hypothetical protein
MAKKNIILSNGDSRVTSTSSFGYDDVTGEISASNMQIGELTLSGAPQKVISAVNGVLTADITPGVSGSSLQYDATGWVSVEQTPQLSTGPAGGDLGGTYPSPTVVNISNVADNKLSIDHGGTGADLTTTNPALAIYSNGQFRTIEADPSLVGTVLTTSGSQWKMTAPKSIYPNVQFFTSSGVWSNAHGAKLARVIVQGGGGAGGNGPKETTTYTPGGGGGSGGWADLHQPVYTLTGAVVTVGAGGAQKEAASVAGNAGGLSAFGVSGQDCYVYANGGTGGGAGSATVAAAAGGTAGATSTNVFTKSGVAGAAYNAVGVAGSDVSTGGGLPYTYLGGTPTYGPGTITSMLNGAKNFGYGVDTAGNIIGKLIASGAVGANPALMETSQKVDPYSLLHMKPFTEKVVDVQTSQSAYVPVISYNGAAGFTNERINTAIAGDSGYSLKPMLNNDSGRYNTGSVTITPGYSLGTADFTAECWLYLNTSGSNRDATVGIRGYIVDTRVGSVNTNARYGFTIQDNARLGLYVGGSATLLVSSSQTVSLNQWTHVALVRQNSTASFYINGTKDTNMAVWSATLNDSANGINIGSHAMGTTNATIDGYINNFRIIKGAQYTANYTVPTTLFVKDNNTVVLVNGAPYDQVQTTKTVDSSYHGRTVTFNGAANITASATNFETSGYALSPVSATNKTGSITITPGQDLGTGDFTTEFWVKLNSTGSNLDAVTGQNRMAIIDTRAGTTDVNSYMISYCNGGKLGFYNAVGTTNILTSSLTINTGSWNHVAFVRYNSTGSFYVNGTKDTNSAVITNAFSKNTNVMIGAYSNATQYSLDGLVDEFRITPKALYTGASFVTSSVRFSDPYNPLLLLHMQPVDGNSKMTVDNSKWNRDVSFTGVASVGSASITNIGGSPFNPVENSLTLTAADGALLVQNSTGLGAGAFTFEAWVKPTARATTMSTIFDSRTTSTTDTGGIIIGLSSVGQLQLYSGPTLVYTSNLMVPLNAWTHIAVVRYSTGTGGVMFYINGIKDTKSSLTLATNLVGTRNLIGDVIDNNAAYQFIGYISDVRISRTALYNNPTLSIPTAYFQNPSSYTVSKIAAGKAGSYGSGGGGGGSTYGVLQDLNRGYMGGKGGDGYVLVISW